MTEELLEQLKQKVADWEHSPEGIELFTWMNVPPGRFVWYVKESPWVSNAYTTSEEEPDTFDNNYVQVSLIHGLTIASEQHGAIQIRFGWDKNERVCLYSEAPVPAGLID